MPVSDGFIELLQEALEPLCPISVRRMFGGAGIYFGPAMFGLVADDTLYLKADDETRVHFEAEGLGPFVYEGKGKPIRMSYWRAPERLLDEPEQLLVWAARALDVSRRVGTPKSKPASKPRAAGPTRGKPRR